MNRTDLHAGRILTLQAHHRNGDCGFFILENMHVGKLRIKFAEVSERTRQLAGTASDTFFRLDHDLFHKLSGILNALHLLILNQRVSPFRKKQQNFRLLILL